MNDKYQTSRGCVKHTNTHNVNINKNNMKLLKEDYNQKIIGIIITNDKVNVKMVSSSLKMDDKCYLITSELRFDD